MTSESARQVDDMAQNVDDMPRYVDDIAVAKEENIQLTSLHVDDMPGDVNTQLDIISTGDEGSSGNCVCMFV